MAAAATPPTAPLDMAVVVHIGIVEHDLPPPAEFTGPVGFAFHEAIDDADRRQGRSLADARSGRSRPALRMES